MFRPQFGHHQANAEHIKRYSKVSTPIEWSLCSKLYMFCIGLMMAELRPKRVALMWTDFAYFDHCVDIQDVPGGKDLTSGECSLGQTIPVKPKTPISKVQWLRRYRPEKVWTSLVSAYCTLSVTSYSAYPLDHNGMSPVYFSCIPTLLLDAAERPWLRIRWLQCL